MKSLLRVAGLVAGMYLLYAAALYFLQDRILFPGTALPVPGAMPKTADARLIDLPISGGRSVAFYLPPTPTSPGPKRRAAMIIAHGNGEIADYLVDALEGWRSMGIALLIVEYPGYGRAPGAPNEGGISQTMAAAFDWLALQPDVDATRIVAHGISLGGGAVGLLLPQRPLAAAILHSTFTSLRAFPPRYGLPSFLLKHEMNTVDAVLATRTPVLVIHGKDDTIIEPSHGVALARAARMSDFALWPCGHGCFHDDGRPLFQRMQTFLRTHGVVD